MNAVLEKTSAQFRLEGKLTEQSFYLPGIFTFDEYLGLHEDQIRSEWIDGRVLIMAAASVAHQRIGSFLEVLLKIYSAKHQIGEVFRAPIAVKINIFRRTRTRFVFYQKGKSAHRQTDVREGRT